MNKKPIFSIFRILLVPFIIFIFAACERQNNLLSEEPVTITLNNTDEILYTTSSPSYEYLIIWGREMWPDGDCSLWIVNPSLQESTRTAIDTPWCNFAVINESNEHRLISFPMYPELFINEEQVYEIDIYEINEDGQLQHSQTIPLPGIRITDVPQFGTDDIIYFSGIKDDKESIYAYDGKTQSVSLYITTTEGFATSPVISPNSEYIVYEIWKDHESKEHNSRDDCGQLTCFARFSHVWDIQSNTDIDLASYIEPFTNGESYNSYCAPEWSSTSFFLALNAGCENQQSGSIIVFDTHQWDSPVIIQSADDINSIIKFHWLKDNQLVLNGTAQIFGQDIVEDGYLVYSAGTNSIEKMGGLPDRNIYDYDLVYFNDWTNDAEFAVGQTQVPDENRIVNIIVANSWDKSDQEYILSPDEFVDDLTWSPTANFIAYRSYNWDTEESQSRFMIIDAIGSTIFDSKMIKIVFPKFQWYLEN